MRISFIGLGHLNSAILAGLLAKGFPRDQISATVHSAESATVRGQEFDLNVVATQTDPAANKTAVADADIVVLGVKPVHIVDTAQDIAAALKPDTTVVSVAAGIPLTTLAEALPQNQPLVRTMPNVALTVGKGAVGMAPGETVTEDQLVEVEKLFNGSGTVFQLPEDQLNTMAAVAGSGPGYVFRFVNALAAAGTQLGLEASVAQELARLTVVGAGTMLDTDDADPTALERSIATEGGVTEAALDSMDANGFNQLIVDALKANIARSEELGA